MIYRRSRGAPRPSSKIDGPNALVVAPTSEGLAANLDRGAELNRLMVAWRKRVRHDRRRRGRGHLAHPSQEWVAARVGVSAGYYGALERGERGGYSPEVLDAVADCLCLSTGERRVLYHLAIDREPAPRPYAEPKISDAVLDMLHDQIWPAYICDAAWNTLAYNGTAAEWFPHLYTEPNWMRWVFLDPTSPEQLIGWETVHAPLMLAQLRAQFAVMPGNQAVADVLTEILENSPVARRIWKNDPRVWLHEDGDVREILPPGADAPIAVEVLSWTPNRNPDLRATMLRPRDRDGMTRARTGLRVFVNTLTWFTS